MGRRLLSSPWTLCCYCTTTVLGEGGGATGRGRGRGGGMTVAVLPKTGGTIEWEKEASKT